MDSSFVAIGDYLIYRIRYIVQCYGNLSIAVIGFIRVFIPSAVDSITDIIVSPGIAKKLEPYTYYHIWSFPKPHRCSSPYTRRSISYHRPAVNSNIALSPSLLRLTLSALFTLISG